ncbi:MAG: DUF1569 domain-containing protein [Candidatus Hydrogenedentes bacterium]|nr:DUF1569 domain-containing protein [Candidatus Hydrogenedentota bacterium]
MRPLDHDYVNDLIARLGRLRPDAKPAWGTLTPDRMVGHLMVIVRYSMGRGKPVPARGNWFIRWIVGPLIINGIVRMPRNVTGPAAAEALCPSGDTETLHAVLEEYLTLVQSGDLEPPPHPFFGDIGVDGWAKLHVVHFEHHLRQFGV